MVNIVRYPDRKLSCGTFWSDPSDLDFVKIKNQAAMACRLKDGVAIAAPQLGILQRWFYHARLHRVFVNPAITDSSEDVEIGIEGCLSLPDRWFPVERRTHILLHWEDEDGSKQTANFYGEEARIIQHEVDHLNGICIADK